MVPAEGTEGRELEGTEGKAEGVPDCPVEDEGCTGAEEAFAKEIEGSWMAGC